MEVQGSGIWWLDVAHGMQLLSRQGELQHVLDLWFRYLQMEWSVMLSLNSTARTP